MSDPPLSSNKKKLDPPLRQVKKSLDPPGNTQLVHQVFIAMPLTSCFVCKNAKQIASAFST